MDSEASITQIVFPVSKAKELFATAEWSNQMTET